MIFMQGGFSVIFRSFLGPSHGVSSQGYRTRPRVSGLCVYCDVLACALEQIRRSTQSSRNVHTKYTVLDNACLRPPCSGTPASVGGAFMICATDWRYHIKFSENANIFQCGQVLIDEVYTSRYIGRYIKPYVLRFIQSIHKVSVILFSTSASVAYRLRYRIRKPISRIGD